MELGFGFVRPRLWLAHRAVWASPATCVDCFLRLISAFLPGSLLESCPNLRQRLKCAVSLTVRKPDRFWNTVPSIRNSLVFWVGEQCVKCIDLMKLEALNSLRLCVNLVFCSDACFAAQTQCFGSRVRRGRFEVSCLAGLFKQGVPQTALFFFWAVSAAEETKTARLSKPGCWSWTRRCSQGAAAPFLVCWFVELADVLS